MHVGITRSTTKREKRDLKNELGLAFIKKSGTNQNTR